MKKILFCITCTLILTVSLRAAQAQTTRFVGPGGDNENPGTQQAPLATIARALALSADSGDTITILPGTYAGEGNQDLDVSHSQIVIRGAAGAPRPLIRVEAGHDGFVFSSFEADSNTVLDRVHVLGADVGAGVFGPPMHFTDCRFDSCGSGLQIDFNAAYGMRSAVRGCEFLACSKGIDFTNWRSRTEVSDCIFEGGGTGVFQKYTFKDDNLKSSVFAEISNCRFYQVNTAINNRDTVSLPVVQHSQIRDCVNAFKGRIEAQSCLVKDCQFGSIDQDNTEPALFLNCHFQGISETVFGAWSGYWPDEVQAIDCLIEDCGTIASLANELEGRAKLFLNNCVLQNNTGGISAAVRFVEITLKDCVYTNNGAGINYHCRSGGGLFISGCTFAQTTGDLLTVVDAMDEPWGPKETLTLTNSILAHSNGAAFRVTGTVDVPVTITNCNFYDNSGGNFYDWPDPVGTNGNFIADPELGTLPGGQVLLSPTSPCRPENHPSGLLIGATWTASVGDSLSTCAFSPDPLVLPESTGSLSPVTVAVTMTNTSGNTLYQDLSFAGGASPFAEGQYSILPPTVILDADESIELAVTYTPSGAREGTGLTDNLLIGNTPATLDLQVPDDWFYLVGFSADTLHFQAGALGVGVDQTLTLVNEAGGNPLFSLPLSGAGLPEFVLTGGPAALMPGENQITLTYTPSDAGNDTIVLGPEAFSSTSGGSLVSTPTVLIGHGPATSCLVITAEDPAQALVSCTTPRPVDFVFDFQAGTAGLKGYSIHLWADPALALFPEDVSVHSIPAGETGFSQVTDLGDNELFIDYAVMGGGALNLAATDTLFTVLVHGASEGLGQLRILEAQFRDGDNQDLPVDVADSLVVTVDCTAPGGVADLTLASDPGRVTLSWTPPDDGDLAEQLVFRGSWLNEAGGSAYPVYGQDSTSTQAPLLADLAAFQDSDRWQPVASLAAGASSYVDSTSARGVYFYQVFTRDLARNASAVPDTLLSAINYLLGDVADPWDDALDIADLSVLGDCYRTSRGHVLFNEECDVGPTTTGSGLDVPLPDGEIEFEDLMIFASNFGRTAAKNTPAPEACPVVMFSWRPLGENQYSLLLAEPCPGLRGLHLVGQGPGWSAAEGFRGDLCAQVPGAWLASGHQDGLLDLGLVLLEQPLGEEQTGELLRIVSQHPLTRDQLQLEARGGGNQPLNWTYTGTTDAPSVPARFHLSANFPNPFNPETVIRFSLPQACEVRLQVFALNGRLVKTLEKGHLATGHHLVTWDGKDDQGAAVSSGVYFYRLEAGDHVQTRKMVLMK